MIRDSCDRIESDEDHMIQEVDRPIRIEQPHEASTLESTGSKRKQNYFCLLIPSMSANDAPASASAGSSAISIDVPNDLLMHL